MGKTCGCQTQYGRAQELEDFMNYSKTIDDLDTYDKFYRVVCYPLHCLQASDFFKELDNIHKIERARDRTRQVHRGIRQDADLVSLKSLIDYLQDCEFWPTQLSDKSSTFKKLLLTPDLFVGGNSNNRESNFIRGGQGRKRQQSSDTKRMVHADMYQSHIKPNLQQNWHAEEETGATLSISFKRRPSIDAILTAPSFVNQTTEPETTPELKHMFSQGLEPGYALPTAIQTGPDFNLICYNEKGRPISKQKIVEENNLEDQQIDIFAIKMLALLMCRDSVRVKSILFLDAVIGHDGLLLGRDTVTINSSRLRKAMQWLLFFSEIFPKKHYSQFQQEVGDENEGTDPYWSHEYVTAADEFLQNHFDEMYMGVFLSKFFGDLDCTFTRKEFMKKTCGNTFRKSKLDWLFTPTALRARFKDNFQVVLNRHFPPLQHQNARLPV